MTQETQVATRAGWYVLCGRSGRGAGGFEFDGESVVCGASGQRGRGVVYAVDLFGSCLARWGLAVGAAGAGRDDDAGVVCVF